VSVETVQIRPELDRAALAKAEKDLEKTFSPTGRAVAGLKKDMGAFWRESSKAAAASAAGKKNAKDWAKASKDAQGAVARMAEGLKTAEGTLGKSHRMVREMRIEYQKASFEASKLERASRASAGRELLSKARSAVGGAISTGVKAGGVAALGAVAGTVAIASKIRAEMDRAAKSANLTVEEFSRLKHAARLSGTSIEVVEKSSSLLQKNLSKAKPSPEFESGLKALGLGIKDLDKLSPEQRLQAIADGMQNIQDDTLKTEVATRLFGEAGAGLVPMLQNGGAAIRTMGDEAAELGLVFSAEAAAGAERFGDAQQKLGDAVKGTLMEAFASIVPLLAEVTEGMVEWVKANREIVSGKLQAGIQSLVKVFQALAEKAAAVDWSVWIDRLTATATLATSVAKALLEVSKLLGPTGTAFAVLGVKMAGSLMPLITNLGLVKTAVMGALGPWGLLAAAGIAAGVAIAGAMADAEKRTQSLVRSVLRGVDEAKFKKGTEGKTAAELRAQRDALDKEARERQRIAGDVRGKTPKQIMALEKERQKDSESTARKRAELEAAISSRQRSEEDDSVARIREREEARNKPKEKPTSPNLRGGGSKGKAEKSASEQRIESDLQALAERAGAREYQRVLQAGGTTAEADKAALATQKAARKRLDEQASDLARKGFVGGSGGPSFVGGPATGAGGAVPVSIDLGGQGGPPPVQIINILQNAQIDIPIETAASAEAVSSAVASGIRTVLRQAVAEALPLGSTSLRA
jgi:hypothetical protein